MLMILSWPEVPLYSNIIQRNRKASATIINVLSPRAACDSAYYACQYGLRHQALFRKIHPAAEEELALDNLRHHNLLASSIRGFRSP